jgi:hypothetical protein
MMGRFPRFAILFLYHSQIYDILHFFPIRHALAHTIKVRVPRALETLKTLETLAKIIGPAGCKSHLVMGVGLGSGIGKQFIKLKNIFDYT